MAPLNWCDTPSILRRPDLLAVFLLLCVVMGLHSPIAFEGRLPLDEDTLLFFYPLRAISQDPFVGLWDPYLFCGFPRDGNPQSQLLYPPNILLSFLPAPRAYAVLLIGHLAAGVIGVYFLCRFLDCGVLASFVGALGCAGGSFWWCKAVNLGNMEGNAWIPFLLLAFLNGLERNSLCWVILAGVFGALIVGAGAPHPVIYSAMLCLFFWAWIRRFHIDRQTAQYALIIIVVAAGLSAWSWMPAAEYLSRSNRAPLGPEEAYQGALALRDFPGVLLCGLTQPKVTRLDPWEGTLFFSITGLILAGFGVVARKGRRETWALLTATAVGFLFALGPNTPVYPLFHRFVPGAAYLNLPNRALLMAAWSIPVLIAFGAERILRAGVLRKWFLPAFVLCIVGCFALLVHLAFKHSLWLLSLRNPAFTATFDANAVPDMELMIALALFGVSLTALVLWLPAHRAWGYAPHLAGIAVLMLVQMFYVTPRFFVEYTSPNFFDPPPAVRWVQERYRVQQGRVLGHSKAISDSGDVRCAWNAPHLAHRFPEIFRLREIQGYEPVYPRQYGELIRAWAGQSRASNALRNVQLETAPPRLIDFLGVETIIGNPADRLCKLPQVILKSGERKALSLSDPIRTDRLFIRHTCRDMSGLPDDTVIGTIEIRNVSGEFREFPVRYGSDLADFLPEDARGFRQAQVFHWWPVPYIRGYRPAVSYWARWAVDPPIEATSVAFRCDAPRGEWSPIEMMLTDTEREIYPRIFENNGVEVFENPTAFPPAWIATHWELISDATERIEIMISGQINLRETVLFDQFPPSDCMVSNREEAISITIERPSSDEILFQISPNTEGFLIVTEGYSPWWRAEMNGGSVPVLRADHAFMAIPIHGEAGILRLRYRPIIFYLACCLSGIVLLGGIAAATIKVRNSLTGRKGSIARGDFCLRSK
ncbi:MAG TPA: hypothetical protein PLQ35_12585 [bacterium]|nr:hypothetical protein [bacterium]HQL63124.1 hypothetical protein [bacterium]